MEWLMIIAFIVISVLESKKKSDNARQQREKRQQMQGQSVYRTDGGSIAQPKAKRLPQSPNRHLPDRSRKKRRVV